MGILQHHDAITGTCEEPVAQDYALRLFKGNQACQNLISQAFQNLLPKNKTRAVNQTTCALLNVSRCDISESNTRFTVTVYNPIARMRQHVVRVPILGSSYSVTGPDARIVDAQFVPVSPETRSLPAFNGSKATGELVFMVELPALGFNTYFIQSTSDPLHTTRSERKHVTGDKVINNGVLALGFDGVTGLLKSMVSVAESFEVQVKQSLLYYPSATDEHGHSQSTSYVFRPNQSQPLMISNKANITVVQGSLVQEVHQVFGDWASQVFRLYKFSPYVEIEWTVGPIPYKDKVGKEVISRFETSLKTDKTFYTDANGREIQKRVRDYRPTWRLNISEEVAGNYYPVSSRIYIKDTTDNIQLTVLTDRSQGGASIKDGQMELMLHRRLFDGRLNETGINGRGLIVRGKHLVALNTTGSSSYLHRDAGEKLFMQPHLTFAPLKMSVKDYIKNFNTMWSGVKTSLPHNVHLLTLQQLTSDAFILRLENFYEKTDTGSGTTKVSLKDLFSQFTVTGVQELTLGANQDLTRVKRLQWNIKDYGRTQADMSMYVTPVDPTALIVILRPMQIRTFKVFFQPVKS